MSNTVNFDPGMGEFVEDLNDYVNRIYSSLIGLKSLSQKRAKFRMFVSSIEKKMENNISFYAGCLLWGYIIKTENSDSPKDISGNNFLFLSDDDLKDYDYMLQINFLENFFDTFERDYLYYIGKKFTIPQSWKNILSLYGEFLSLNNGFIRTKNTSEIVLPETLKNMKFNCDINKIINSAVLKKDLSVILKSGCFS